MSNFIPSSTPQPPHEQAEQQPAARLSKLESLTLDELRRVAHELQEKQVELERVNDELRRAIARQEQAQAQFYALFNRTPVGYLVLDANGQIQQANTTFLEMTGSAYEQVTGRLISDLVVAPDRSAFQGSFKEFFDNPQGKTIDLHLRCETGYFEAQMTGALLESGWQLRSTSGEGRILVTITDTSEFWLTHRARRSTDDLLEQISNSIGEFFWLRERISQQYLFVSSAYEKIWGRPARELMERPLSFMEAIHPADKDSILVFHWRLQEQALPYEAEFRVIRPDGSQRWVWSRVFPVFDEDGNPSRVAGVATDITDRKKVEEMLQTSRQAYRNLFESMQEAMLMYEILPDEAGKPYDYRFLDANPAFERLTGWPRTALAGHTVRSAFPPEEADYWIDKFRPVAESGESITFAYKSKNLGRTLSVTAYRPADGQFAAILTDTGITEA